MPVHLRWELYPVIHEEKYPSASSYLEEKDWWLKKRKKKYLRGFFFLLKDYFILSDYAKGKFLYWLGLYPWHMGFILTMFFEFLCFISGLYIIRGGQVSDSSPSIVGTFLYHMTLIIGVLSFLTGMVGSVLIFLNRVFDKSLREYAVLLHYITYGVTFLLFFTGFYSWFFTDPKLEEYRLFWAGLLSFDFSRVGLWTAIHIMVYDLFLLYLPYTRWLHYITRFFAFFFIRWDDEPNIPGSSLERKVARLLEKKVTWSAPHIDKGKSWVDLARV